MKVTIRQKSGMKYLYADIQVSGLRYKSTLGISVNDGVFNLEKQCVEGGTNTETNILISSFKKNILDTVRRLQIDGELSLACLTLAFKQIRDRLTSG